MESLSSDPKILSRFLEAIADDMEDMTPNYELLTSTMVICWHHSLIQ